MGQGPKGQSLASPPAARRGVKRGEVKGGGGCERGSEAQRAQSSSTTEIIGLNSSETERVQGLGK